MNDTVENRIKNKSIISLEALRNYALNAIKDKELMHLCSDVISTNNNYYVMAYSRYYEHLIIDIDKTVDCAKHDMTETIDRASKLIQIKLCTRYLSTKYRTNVINLYIIYYINHEIEHVKQWDLIENHPNDNISKLLKVSADLTETNFDLYLTYHDYYLHEYQADMYAAFAILEEMETKYKNIISNNELEFFNMSVACAIKNGYIQNYNNEAVGPLGFLKMLCKHSNYGNDDYINELVQNEEKQHNSSDLLVGRNISPDILNWVDDISKGKVKTKSIFKSIYNK